MYELMFVGRLIRQVCLNVSGQQIICTSSYIFADSGISSSRDTKLTRTMIYKIRKSFDIVLLPDVRSSQPYEFSVFWHVTHFQLVNTYRRFEEFLSLYLYDQTVLEIAPHNLQECMKM